MSFFSEEQAAELRELFFESSQELLQELNDAGLELEHHPASSESLQRVRRAVHTLKGDAAACGYAEFSSLAHELEDMLGSDLLQSSGTPLAELVLTAADTFHAMLAAYRGHLQPPAGEALREYMKRLARKPDSASATAPLQAEEEWRESELSRIRATLGAGDSVYSIAVRMNAGNPMRAPALQMVRAALQSCGTVLAMHPSDAAGSAEILHAAMASRHTPQAIKTRCLIPAVVSEILVQPLHGAQESKSAAGPRDLLDVLLHAEAQASGAPSDVSAPPSSSSALPAAAATPESLRSASGESVVAANAASKNTLRVDAARIDTVLNLVGELIIGKSMLQRAFQEFDARFSKDPLRAKLSDAIAFQSRVLDELQKSVLKIRMVPVDQLFRRVPRLVRDVAKSRGREVRVELTGQNTDLDKGILDILAEPLSHIVRNAVDHGIEAPAERLAAGKPAVGTIRLRAYHQGSQVVIEISDDGCGIRSNKLVSAAVDRRILTAEQAAGLSESEALDLIFQPGLSTADEITKISGRGVGMDVVRSVLARLKGTVSVKSTPGAGAAFLLAVPLTLASVPCLLFRISGRVYAVPMSAVQEITRLAGSEIHCVDHREVLQLRGQTLTLARLDRSPFALAHPAKRLLLLVLAAAERRFALLVDSLLGEEELVIRALDDPLVANDLVNGASLLGDGTVVLVLNVAALFTHMSKTPVLGATA